MLEADGALDALELTGGSSLANPMYLFRGEAPPAEFAATLPASAARSGFRLVGRRFLPDYPFEEAFFLPYARQFRDALDLPLILLGGINRLETIEGALDEGFAFVAMARALLREPDLVDQMASGASTDVAVHPLQQVHAHHLQGHPLRAAGPPNRGQLSRAGRRPGRSWILVARVRVARSRLSGASRSQPSSRRPPACGPGAILRGRRGRRSAVEGGHGSGSSSSTPASSSSRSSTCRVGSSEGVELDCFEEIGIQLGSSSMASSPCSKVSDPRWLVRMTNRRCGSW